MLQLSDEQVTTLAGFLETIKDEAEAMPQVGGSEATIIEQADGALELLMIECRECSIAGGADRAVFHLPPACKPAAAPARGEVDPAETR
jgi:hypothetical protein